MTGTQRRLGSAPSADDAGQDIGATVVVATYHRVNRLAACMTGLRSQSRPPDEVLVVVHSSDEAGAELVRRLARDWPVLRCLPVEQPGTVAAYARGLAAARGAVVAYVDDDAVPRVDWLERIVATFESDERIAAVGGRDLVFENGHVAYEPGSRGARVSGSLVGRLRWFGRMLGNHHIGVGAPRDVDVIKGANMSFRRAAVAAIGFDERLRGHGAQVHSELSICLPLRRRGLRVVYDPQIEVAHYPAPRLYGDQRDTLDRKAVFAWAHNESLQILDHLGAARRLVFSAWALAIGSSEAPGLAVLVRDLVERRPRTWTRFAAAQRGRAAAWRTMRTPRAAASELLPCLLHRPELRWRQRHVFGALRLRPAVAQHSDPEAALLKRYAADAEVIVELGVAEGGSAAELRSVMSPTGRLYLVDPYEPGRLGLSMARIVARRTVNRVRRGRVTWLRLRSDAAVRGWSKAISFLMIDADHSYERAASDWYNWTPFVEPGGYVALHDSAVFPGGWTNARSGPVQLLKEIRQRAPEWVLVDQADSLSVVRRGDEAGVADGERQRRLHILRVADVSNRATAGMSGYMLSSGAEIQRRGHQVSFRFQDRLAPRLRHTGLRRLLVPWLIVIDVIRAVRRGAHYDVVEIHEPLAGAYGLVARLIPGRLPACAVLSHGVNDRYWQAEQAHLSAYGRRPPLKSRVLVPLTLLSQANLGLRTAEAVLVTSSADREYLIGEKRIPIERVGCAFGGVSEELFDVPRTSSENVRLLFLGSWLERKGTLELVAAWRRVAAERANVSLTIAGAGGGEGAYAELADLPRVELIAAVERHALPDLLAVHDVFVLPSWFEGMPLAMLEAAAAGLACVVCALCGNLDVFRSEDPKRDGAILIPPSDTEALHKALLEVVDDGELRAALGASARERARRFTWAANAEQTVAAYSAATKRWASTGSPDGHRWWPKL
ncbi:MAG: glycosyltransferase [Solirubrobacteraceae bacterium]|jgi:glycosyltransferase involved in cell wall biosynthesis/GT2 family glycosyltransferase/predicted O-methyltransferase YrrM